MARIRSIKPEFWTSAQILECSTNARLMFIGLWTFSDDLGRHPDSAKQIKAEIFPADSFTHETITEWLNELKAHRLLIPYVHEGKGYFYVSGWHHQRIDKPQKAKYPAPLQEHSMNVHGTIPPDPILSDTIRYDTTQQAKNGFVQGEEGKRPSRKKEKPKHGTKTKDGKRLWLDAETEEWKQYADDFKSAHNGIQPTKQWNNSGTWFNLAGEITHGPAHRS